MTEEYTNAIHQLACDPRSITRLCWSLFLTQLDFFGVQQSPDVEATWSASPFS